MWEKHSTEADEDPARSRIHGRGVGAAEERCLQQHATSHGLDSERDGIAANDVRQATTRSRCKVCEWGTQDAAGGQGVPCGTGRIPAGPLERQGRPTSDCKGERVPDAGECTTVSQFVGKPLINSVLFSFLSSLDRIRLPEYVPTEQDILLSRIKTTGIVEVKFQMKNVDFRWEKITGSFPANRKVLQGIWRWRPAIRTKKMDSLLRRRQCNHFHRSHLGIRSSVVWGWNYSRIERDSPTQMNAFQNRMIESMRLFESICNSRWFINTSMILFLNKKDLFLEKIKRTSIKVAFPDYKGMCRMAWLLASELCLFQEPRHTMNRVVSSKRSLTDWTRTRRRQSTCIRRAPRTRTKCRWS